MTAFVRLTREDDLVLVLEILRMEATLRLMYSSASKAKI